MQDVQVNQQNNLLLSIIMVLVGVFGLIATDIYAPSLPKIPEMFHTTAAFAQLTVSFFLLGYAISQLIAGQLSDHYGRRPVLIFGLMVFTLGTVLCIFAHSITMLLAGRVLEGIGAGAIAVLSRILLRDLFSGLRLAQFASYLSVLSPAIAPVLGGLIQQYIGFAAIFVFLLLFAAILFSDLSYARDESLSSPIRFKL